MLLASIRCLANPDLFRPKFDFCAIFVFGLLRDFCFLFAARLLFSALYWGLKFEFYAIFIFLVSARLRPSLLSIFGFCPVLVLDRGCVPTGQRPKMHSHSHQKIRIG